MRNDTADEPYGRCGSTNVIGTLHNSLGFLGLGWFGLVLVWFGLGFGLGFGYPSTQPKPNQTNLILWAEPKLDKITNPPGA